MCSTNVRAFLLLGLLSLGASQSVLAHTCPDGAISTGLGLVFTAFRTNSVTGTLQPIGAGGVGICETIFLQGSLNYDPRDSQGNIIAAYSAGNVVVSTALGPTPSFSQDVTPVGGVPQIGPLPSTCDPPSVADNLGTRVAAYTIDPADIVNGRITFFMDYGDGTAHIGDDLVGVEGATTAIFVRVSQGPSCTIAPATTEVCAGASATFTTTGTGEACPCTFTWSGPGGFTASGDTITVSVAGTYTATVTDAHGCNNTCQATLVNLVNPTCTITGPSSVDCVSTTTFTATVSPAGGTVTHSWSISGSACATIQGSTTGSSVTVAVICPGGGSFTLTDNFTRDGCPGQCSADVTCAMAAECRVAGGGTLLPGTVDRSCADVNTTIFPASTPNGLVVEKIIHGGELGAPFSQQDCGGTLGNRCIRGQWQHIRQYVGQANPRDVFDMEFHSVTPKGQFDSLLCACLGCCDPATGMFITPITLGNLCNPDDHQMCGPQPGPAPANAIIFSGIGKLTPTTASGANAKAAEWVVFRVYIADRSEPGGFHPAGAVEPADIYCFQAWKTSISVVKSPDFSTVDLDFRRALGTDNCAFLASLKAGTIPIGTLPSPTGQNSQLRAADIQDCGPLHDGDHQIFPATGTSENCTP